MITNSIHFVFIRDIVRVCLWQNSYEAKSTLRFPYLYVKTSYDAR